MTKQITFITGNPGKAEQLSKYLGRPVLHHSLDLIEIQSLELTEVIKHKVIEAYQQIKQPVLVDDVALTIHSMGKLPGPFIKYFIKELGNEGICKLLSNYEDKSAIATVAIGYYDGNDVYTFIGTVNGSISKTPKGSGGFGWDQIFIPDGYFQTRAEMNEEDYDETSPRKDALMQLETFLKTIE
jgi:non-canonical purine NTP pyrophosphatase (RdgB/HAM1 family)